MWNLKDFLSFRGQVFQRTNMWIFLLFVCSIILWTAISFLYFVPSCFLLDSLWDKIRQLYSLHMAKKAEFGFWMNWGIKEYFQYVILLLIHLSIQTKPSWPYAKSTISLKPSENQNNTVHRWGDVLGSQLWTGQCSYFSVCVQKSAYSGREFYSHFR